MLTLHRPPTGAQPFRPAVTCKSLCWPQGDCWLAFRRISSPRPRFVNLGSGQHLQGPQAPGLWNRGMRSPLGPEMFWERGAWVSWELLGFFCGTLLITRIAVPLNVADLRGDLRELLDHKRNLPGERRCARVQRWQQVAATSALLFS